MVFIFCFVCLAICGCMILVKETYIVFLRKEAKQNIIITLTLSWNLKSKQVKFLEVCLICFALEFSLSF